MIIQMKTLMQVKGKCSRVVAKLHFFWGATCGNMWQHVATCGNMWQHVATCGKTRAGRTTVVLPCTAMHNSTAHSSQAYDACGC